MVDDYKQQRLLASAAHSTILNEVRLLSHAFNTVKWCRPNPVSEAERIKLKARKVERYLSPDEEPLLLKAAESKLFDQLRDVIILGLNTGLSQEEVMSLQWPQINFFVKILRTTRSKTLKARNIPLNSAALEVLKRLSKVKAISGYVFFNSVGKQIDAGKLKREFGKAVEEAGIQQFRFHDLRHTFASRLIKAGIDISTVSKLLGHSRISTAADYYAHHCVDSLRRGIEVLDKVCYNFATPVDDNPASSLNMLN